MGRYIPPDLEGLKTFNQASNKRFPSNPTIRFECPFAIWCTTCQPPQLIAQGVRFNALKTRVGNYFSTPIWGFRFKHAVCGGWIEVRTDPARTEYVVFSGGTRRDTGEGRQVLEGQIETAVATGAKDDEDAFASLECKVENQSVVVGEQARISELRKRRERDWADPYEVNKRIRRDFRAARRERKSEQDSARGLQEKYGLAIEVLGQGVDDGERAALVRFGAVDAAHVNVNSKNMLGENRNLPVEGKTRKDRGMRGRTAEQKTAKTVLRDTLSNNTRGKVDPFLATSTTDQSVRYRSRPRHGHSATDSEKLESATASTTTPSLVAYDSDSD